MSIIDKALADYANVATVNINEPSILDKISVQVANENILNESAISVKDRFKWGFADDFGKQRILMENGYDPSQVVRLRNGDWGVRTEYGIKPVDPKGFQLSDIGSDIAESVGKSITAGGGILGGLAAGSGSLGTGTAVGVGLGSAAGESIRQAIGAKMGVRNIENLTKTAFKDENGWHFGGLGEIAAEGVLGGSAQKLTGVIAGKMAEAGTIKLATNSADNILSVGEIKPKVIDAITDAVGLPKGTNKRLLKEFLDPNGAIKYIPHEGAIDETTLRAGNKIINIVEHGKGIIDDIYSKGLKDAGIDTNTLKVDVGNAVYTLDKSIDKLAQNDIAGIHKKTINSLTGVKNAVLSGLDQDGKLPYSQLKNITQALKDIQIQSLQQSGGKTASYYSVNRPFAAFTEAKNTNPIIAGLNKEYGPQIRAVKKLQNLLNIRLEEGLYKEGRLTPEMFIQHLSNGLKGRNLDAIIKADDVLRKSPEFAKLSVKQDLLTALLGQKLSATAPFTGGRLSVSGISESVGKAVLSPRRRAQIIKGLINTGAFNPKALDLEVSKVSPKLSAFFNLASAGNIAPLAGKTIESMSTKEGIKAVVRNIPPSLNGIVYRQ